jgi:hypothetical protein
MDYSTFKLNNFYIKKDSNFPILKYPLTQKVREQYGITDDMFENVAVTFSMIDVDTGLYRIANVGANLIINTDREKYPAEELYTLTFKFSISQTSKSGRYYGEFKLDFLGDNCSNKITLPSEGQINIIISDSITKTTVI